MFTFKKAPLVTLLITLALMPLSAFAYAVDNTSAINNIPVTNTHFFGYAVTFVFGILFTVKLLTLINHSMTIKSWKYISLMTVLLLGLLFCQTFLTQWQNISILIISALFIGLQTFELLTGSEKKDTSNNVIELIKASLLIVTIGFICAIGLMREADIFQLSLGYYAVASLISLFIIYKFLADDQKKLAVAQTIFSLGLGAAIYAWLTLKAPSYIVLLLGLSNYLIMVIRNCVVISSAEFSSNTTNTDNSENNYLVTSNNALDPITNLPTYQQSLFKLSQLLLNKTTTSFVPMVFKPLNFDHVNQMLGHRNSDILLLQLAYNLQKAINDNEALVNFNPEGAPIRIARLQGLDFLIVLEVTETKHPLKSLMESISKTLENAVPKAMSFKSVSLKFELVFGCALPSDELKNADELVAQASDALLNAELNNQKLSYFDPLSALYTEQQLAKMEKLKQDIANDDLKWVVEPQVSLLNQQITGFELSVDWRGNDGKTLSLREFEDIGVFSGEIYHVTKKLIKEAFQLLALLHKQNTIVTVSINLSSKDLLESELADVIERESINANISLEYLVVELDEQILITSKYRARMMIDQLKVLGVNIAIDNFSGGYESLRFLRRTPIEQVKIDCALISTEHTEKTENIIVNTLINLIRKLNIPIVATGINNKKIEQSYKDFGGDVAQGYLINEQLNIDDVNEWLTQWQAKTQRRM